MLSNTCGNGFEHILRKSTLQIGGWGDAFKKAEVSFLSGRGFRMTTVIFQWRSKNLKLRVVLGCVVKRKRQVIHCRNCVGTGRICVGSFVGTVINSYRNGDFVLRDLSSRLLTMEITVPI